MVVDETGQIGIERVDVAVQDLFEDGTDEGARPGGDRLEVVAGVGDVLVDEKRALAVTDEHDLLVGNAGLIERLDQRRDSGKRRLQLRITR